MGVRFPHSEPSMDEGPPWINLPQGESQPPMDEASPRMGDIQMHRAKKHKHKGSAAL